MATSSFKNLNKASLKAKPTYSQIKEWQTNSMSVTTIQSSNSKSYLRCCLTSRLTSITESLNYSKTATTLIPIQLTLTDLSSLSMVSNLFYKAKAIKFTRYFLTISSGLRRIRLVKHSLEKAESQSWH